MTDQELENLYKVADKYSLNDVIDKYELQAFYLDLNPLSQKTLEELLQAAYYTQAQIGENEELLLAVTELENYLQSNK